MTGFYYYCYAGQCDEIAPNSNLTAEKSFGFDVGTDMRLQRDTVLSFDLYRTRLFGQFFTTNTQGRPINGQPLFISSFSNLGASTMEGINLSVKHDVPKGGYWAATWGFARAYVTSLPAAFYDNPSIPCTKCANTAIIPGPNFNNYTYPAGVPYASGSLTLGYRWQPGRYIDLLTTYFGNNNTYNVPAFFGIDAHAGYNLTSNFLVSATLRNVTNAYGQSVQWYIPTAAVPVIKGGTPAFPGAFFSQPYGPRAFIFTGTFKV